MTHILCLLVTNNYGSISISNLKSTYTPWLFLKQIAGWSGTPSDILDCLKTLLFSKLLLLFVCFQIFTYVVVGLGFTCFFTGLIGWVGGVVESTLIWRIFKNVFLYAIINFTKKTFNLIYRSMFGSTLFNLSCFVYVCWIGRNRLFEIRANRGES